MSRKEVALAAVVAATEGATAAEAVWGRNSPHWAVSGADLDAAVRAARAAGASDDEIRSAVASDAFRA